MKPGFIIVLFAIGIGTLVCTTYAAPASSEIQEENDQKELLNLIDQAVKSQQGDEDEDEESAEAQFFRNFLRRNKGRILRGFGNFARGALNGYGGGGGGYKTKAQVKASENLNQVTEQHEEDDADNLVVSESMNVKEALELLKNIAKLQQNIDDENALVDNMEEMAKEEDGEDEDDAQVQRRRRRGRGRKRWRRRRGRGRGRRRGRGRGRRRGGSHWAGTLGHLFGGVVNGLTQPNMEEGYPPQQYIQN